MQPLFTVPANEWVDRICQCFKFSNLVHYLELSTSWSWRDNSYFYLVRDKSLSHRPTFITISIVFWRIRNLFHEKCDPQPLDQPRIHNLCINVCCTPHYPLALQRIDVRAKSGWVLMWCHWITGLCCCVTRYRYMQLAKRLWVLIQQLPKKFFNVQVLNR